MTEEHGFQTKFRREYLVVFVVQKNNYCGMPSSVASLIKLMRRWAVRVSTHDERTESNVLAKGPLGDLVGCEGNIKNVS